MSGNASTFPYGICAYQMVKELKRQSRLIENPFDEEGKRNVIDEIKCLFKYIEDQMQPFKAGAKNPDELLKPYIQADVLIHHNAILRNKQCMLAYMMERMRMIQKLRWEMSSEAIPQEIQESLSPCEKKFKVQYNDLLRNYMNHIDIDLTLNMHNPPQDLYVQVFVIQDHGSIVTEDCSLLLKRNTTITMRRNDAEPLIKLGIVEQVSLN